MLNATRLINENEIIDIANSLLRKALSIRASDIHCEPYHDEYRIRMRIDGVLQLITILPIEQAKAITTRLKIMAKLNIAEQRLPQDGQLAIDGQTMRVSTLPVIMGEKIVLRVMDNAEHVLSIADLGLNDIEQKNYKDCLNAPQGLILVTGPTGSGKTVTLYSGINQINGAERNICSVEDPIEMPIKGVNQTQINPKSGLGFAQTLRAFLRQDPDVMMIGEIRDHETAEIAVQAAQTGHLVLSTLHTNSSAEALIRLNQMGIKNYLIASSLKLIIAQRLVRKLCNHCKKPAVHPFIVEDSDQPKTIQHFVAQGCEHCVGGYFGRTGIYELLVITPDIQALLLKQNEFSFEQIAQFMRQKQIKTLPQSAIDKVIAGETSLDEVQRVITFPFNNQA
ncbi:ATPase, T2SS/T4P/T4SS family [Orbaceae bacterium ac157xtp]